MRFVAPLAGWNVRGWSYAQRQDDGQLQTGADLNVGGGDDDLGMAVVCAAEGIVVARRAWDGWSRGFGNHLLVGHQFGDLPLWTLYAHLEELEGAGEEGERLAAGQRLGACGKSGKQEWAHVHFECRYNAPPEMGASYWGGALPIEELSRLYADPFTLMVVLAALPDS